MSNRLFALSLLFSFIIVSSLVVTNGTDLTPVQAASIYDDISESPPVNIPHNQGGQICDCSSDNYNCPDFGSQQAAQECFNYCQSIVGYDIHKLDGNDNDGLACESLPSLSSDSPIEPPSAAVTTEPPVAAPPTVEAPAEPAIEAPAESPTTAPPVESPAEPAPTSEGKNFAAIPESGSVLTNRGSSTLFLISVSILLLLVGYAVQTVRGK